MPEANNIKVQGIQRLKYSSTCYINAAVQALFSIQEFSDLLESNQLDKSNHPLIFQLQKLYQHCRLSSRQKHASKDLSNKELIDCLNSKKMKIIPERQEDSAEFFENLVEEITNELGKKNTGLMNVPDIKELLKANLVCTVSCKECENGYIIDHAHLIVHLENSKGYQTETTTASKLKELLQAKDKTARCTKCLRETHSKSTFNYGFSKYLCLKIARNTWNSKKNRMERIEQNIKPEKFLEIKFDYQKTKTCYGLIGGIMHKGSANSGHYLNILKISHKWYEIDDAKVTAISESEAIRQLESYGVLVMYQEEEKSEGEQNLSPKLNITKRNEEDEKRGTVEV